MTIDMGVWLVGVPVVVGWPGGEMLAVGVAVPCRSSKISNVGVTSLGDSVGDGVGESGVGQGVRVGGIGVGV